MTAINVNNTMKRYIKYLPLALLFISCAKQPEDEQQSDTFEHHPTWTDSAPDDFWR